MAELDDDTTGNRTPTPVAEPSSRPQVDIGEVIDERYKITSFLGEGGMAMVFQVDRLHFNDVCAMKVGKHTLSQVSGQRFRKEAIATCSLEHPNLLRVYDFGIVNEQYPYFVMDFVDGKTLHRYLRHNGPLSLPSTMEIFAQVCEGMAHAHRKGIVHRDLKPGNIMLIERENHFPLVKVLDFGLAKLLESASDQSLTRPGDVFGSPLYMSPEQCAGIEVDHRSDIYSFGCMLFEALTGRTPFQGDSAIETMMHHRDKTPPTLCKASDGKPFPPELEALVSRLLAKNPDDRPNQFDDVHALLAGACQHEAPPAVTKIDTNESNQSTPLSLKKKVFWVAGITGLLIAGTALCLLALEFASPTRETTISPSRAEFGSPFTVRKEELSSQPYPIHYYSKAVEKNGIKKKIFTFPPGMYLGVLYVFTSSYKRDEGWEAQGTVTIPYNKSIGLHCLGELVSDTRLLRNFRPSDLQEVLFLKRTEVGDSCIDDIKHFSGLRGLEFEMSDLTNASLPRIDSLFPKLDRLTLAACQNLDASEIVKMKIIHRIENFKISGIRDGGIIVRNLIAEAKNHPTRLNYLSATDTGLIDSDLKDIDALTELRTLYIRKNPELTQNAISHIVKCKKLRELDLREMPLTPECGKLLRACRSLKRVIINPHGWNKKQQRTLTESAPGIQFEMRQKIEVDLSDPQPED